MTNLVHLTQHSSQRRGSKSVYFNRDEFRVILDIYSRYVVRGEWRDYAVDATSQRAIFSIFKHSYDAPLYAVTKERKGKGYEFSLIANGQVLKRSRYLINALQPVDRPLKLTEV